jgi:hypothetical protein
MRSRPERAQQAQPARRAQQAQSARRVQPAEPAQPVQPPQPVQPAQPVQAAQPMQASAPRGGKRKAVKNTGHTGSRKNLFATLPSPPTLIGAAALALAATGAVTISSAGLGQFGAGDLQKAAAQASVLNGASSIGSSDALSGRLRAVSRDSERQALQDAADQRLQAAAEAQAKQRNAALAALAASAEKHANILARNAWGLPIPLGSFTLTAGFGQCSLLWAHCHTGLDFAAPEGTPIQAVASGVVTDVGWAGAYGNRTVVTLTDGTELWYCHQSAFEVSMGQTVTRGQVIGRVGATGNVTGPHLHLEVRPGGGDPVDPYPALIAHGLTLGAPNPA